MLTMIADLPVAKQSILRKIMHIQYGLCAAQLLISIFIAFKGRVIIGDSHAEILTFHIENIFPAARRLGLLCTNRLDGELTLGISMLLSILFGVSVFSYFFVQKSAKQSALSFKKAMDELTAGRKIVGFFILMAPVAVVLGDFGVIDFVGFASGKGFDNPKNYVYNFFIGAHGIKLGVVSATYAMSFSALYGFVVFIVARSLGVLFHYDEVSADSE